MSFVSFLKWLLLWAGVESAPVHYSAAPPPSEPADIVSPLVLEASSPPISNGF